MSSLHSIIAATDLSAPSRHAADRAALLATAFGATLTLAHAANTAPLDDLRRWLDGSGDVESAIREESGNRLHAQATDLGKRHGIQVAEHLGWGHPVEEIVSFAQQSGAGLLVAGARGAGFLRGMITGCTAERFIRRAPCPVLLARQSPRGPYRRALVPVDFSPWSAAAIELALQVAPDAVVVLMHAVEVPFEGKLRVAGVEENVVRKYRDAARNEAQQKLRELAAQTGLGRHQFEMATPEGGDPWMLISKEEREQDCDLTVIGRQGRNAVSELLLGSTTRMVIAEGAADVLVSTAAA